MKHIESLENKGIVRIGDPPSSWADKPRTILVLGVARGGTSLVSGALHHLGVFMGDNVSSPVFEDLCLSGTIEKDAWKEFERIIEDYNNKHFIWGYKRPDLFYDVLNDRSEWVKLIRSVIGIKRNKVNRNLVNFFRKFSNPIFVIIFKDILSVANRNSISMNTDMMLNLKNTMKKYELLINFISEVSPNALLTSYDKAIANKKDFINSLIEFCGLIPSVDQVNAAMEYITYSPTEYFDVSRINKSIGFIDIVTNEKIKGWARYLNDERVAEVVLKIDGKKVQRVKANLFRKDLMKNKAHSSGTCAFEFNEFDRALLKSGSEVRVRVIDDFSDLENSPYIYE